MSYSREFIEALFPDRIKDFDSLVIETHKGAQQKTALGTHRRIGELPDSSPNQDGTMVLLEKKPPEQPTVVEKVTKRLRGKK